MQRKEPLVLVFALAVLFLSFSTSFGLTYFRVLVEGVESSTHVQGQMQTLEMDCGSSGEIQIAYYMDIDSSGSIDAGEHALFMLTLPDNSTDFPPDSDPTDGVMVFPWPLSFPPGHYVITASEESMTIERPYRVFPCDPIDRSVSGHITLEGLEPPAPLYENIPLICGTMDPPNLMYSMTDNMGEFYFNWPGGDETIVIMILGYFPGYEPEDEYYLLVDGHVTDFEIFIPAEGFSHFSIFVEGELSNTQYQGQGYSLELNCTALGMIEISVYKDLNSNEVIDYDEPTLFPESWGVYDNASEVGLIFDSNDMEGWIYIVMPLNFPPGDYVIRAREGERVIDNPFHVLPPDPLTMSISGTVILETVTPPNPMLEIIPVYAEGMYSSEIYMSLCNDMGEFTCNWAGAEGDVILKFYEPYPSSEWDFASASVPVYVDGFLTGIEIPVAYSAYDDSILINYTQDPDGMWEVPPSDVQASYFNTDREFIGAVVFPMEGDIYVPVKPEPCGIFFEGSNPYFPLHQFISPAETLWVTPDSFPPEYDIYVNQTNYHFMVFLDGMELDSVPEDGITTYLYGSDLEGHTYFTTHTLFVVYHAEEYVVGGERELCDADWHFIIPDTLPHHYVPAFTETTFTIPEDTNWLWFDLHIPVEYTGIDEKHKPLVFDLNISPNPFNSSTNIDLQLEDAHRVAIRIYNVFGERIDRLVDRKLSKGKHRFTWDGTDSSGKQVPSGIYFFEVEAGNTKNTMKSVYVR
ncbi:T9SS type A sorting domain-containing protein [bacterium]|nr:T9SS type A sorting domain-containing protein [bacterium]